MIREDVGQEWKPEELTLKEEGESQGRVSRRTPTGTERE